MPPRELSRHTFTTGLLDGSERFFLTERVPYRYRTLPDNRTHLVQEGETIFSLAGFMFQPLVRPAGLFWVIADFQPRPIHDPTLALIAGQMLFVPSVRTVREEILSEDRRRETQG